MYDNTIGKKQAISLLPNFLVMRVDFFICIFFLVDHIVYLVNKHKICSKNVNKNTNFHEDIFHILIFDCFYIAHFSIIG